MEAHLLYLKERMFRLPPVVQQLLQDEKMMLSVVIQSQPGPHTHSHPLESLTDDS